MANAADYFLAAMDKYDSARFRQQQLQMQQEEHDQNMALGRLNIAQAQDRIDGLNEAKGVIASGELAQLSDDAYRRAQQQNWQSVQTAQQSAPQTQQPVQHDVTQLQQTVDTISPYMGHINEARGNSGYGQVLSLHPQPDGSVILGAANLDHQSAQPFTVDPKNNSSPPLRIAPEQVSTVNSFLQGQFQTIGNDPAKMQEAAKTMFGLQHDAQGNVFVPGQPAQGQQTAPALNQMPQQATLPNGQPNYGLRVDGTQKGNGYFGPLKTPDGRVATELGIGVNIGGKEVEIPSLVPTLTKQEIDHLVQGGEPTPEIIKKAADFAVSRMKQGKSPFAQAGEQGALPVDSTQAAPQPVSSSANVKTPTTTTGPVFNKAVIDDPQKFQEMANHPDLKLNDRDKQDLDKIDQNGAHAVTMPAARLGKVAAVMLRAGLWNGTEATNFAQTGFTNMNRQQLEEAMDSHNLTKLDIKNKQLEYDVNSKYLAKEAQARLDAQYASINASNMQTKKAQQEFDLNAKWGDQLKEAEIAAKNGTRRTAGLEYLDKNVSSALDNVMKSSKVPEDVATQVKGQFASGLKTVALAAGLIDPSRPQASDTQVLERTAALAMDMQRNPEVVKQIEAAGRDPKDVNVYLALAANRVRGGMFSSNQAGSLPKDTTADQKRLDSVAKDASSAAEAVVNANANDMIQYHGSKKDTSKGEAFKKNFSDAYLMTSDLMGLSATSMQGKAYGPQVIKNIANHVYQMTKGDPTADYVGPTVSATVHALAGLSPEQSSAVWDKEKAFLSVNNISAQEYNNIATKMFYDRSKGRITRLDGPTGRRRDISDAEMYDELMSRLKSYAAEKNANGLSHQSQYDSTLRPAVAVPVPVLSRAQRDATINPMVDVAPFVPLR